MVDNAPVTSRDAWKSADSCQPQNASDRTIFNLCHCVYTVVVVETENKCTPVLSRCIAINRPRVSTFWKS
uniref:SFRICE_013482 n=1 Tax=Spodoptera frugiperda TaxID=7108 RepID=A0A2H1WGW0_SPOFR